MNSALQIALSDLGYRDTIKRAALHADTTIRKYFWRGFRPKQSASGEIMVGDQTAQDFVSEAVLRLISGRRTFDATRPLLDNLNSITDSLISAAKKKSDRGGIVDWVEEADEQGHQVNPISTAKALAPQPDVTLRLTEIREDQRRCVDALMRSFDGDEKMQNYIESLSARLKRSEISQLMEISGSKVDELRRKLGKYARRLFGVTNFRELQQRLQEGD
jgi:DNA-directed RNA polymerase specialized sigma24 family protein